MPTLLDKMEGTGGRAFRKSHPWLTFELETRHWPARLWLALGEARSKCQHLAGVPLKPAVAKQLHQVYLAKGVHATTAIEGNTLSERQVLDRLQSGAKVVPESQAYLQVEIDNVLALANLIIDQVELNGPAPISPEIIRSYNEQILRDLDCDDHVDPGEYRKSTVGVMDYQAPLAEDCEYLVDAMCEWLNGEAFHPARDDEIIVYGIVKSIVAHIYLAWIHPFGDGNGRTARALEVRFLMEAGIPSSAIHLLSNHYNKTRSEYYRRLSEASKSGGDLTNFVAYATTGFVDQLREQIAAIRAQQWEVAWQNYIYEEFGQDKTISDKRQIALLLALSKTDNFVPVAKLRRLTPELAEMYAGKTPKTLSRDLNRLAEKGFVERGEEGVRARKEIILAFLPRMRKGGFETHFAHGKRMREEAGTLGLDVLALLDLK